jgi:hypothetical protein
MLAGGAGWGRAPGRQVAVLSEKGRQSMIAVIMQPTYLPWIGYFDLMDRADVFVLLDTVQFEKQSWQQRNRIKTGDAGSKWLTVPVVQSLDQKFSAVRIETSNPWRRKHWRTIDQYYRQAPFWKQYSEALSALYSREWDVLFDWNVAVITHLKERFGIKTKVVRASQLPVSGDKVGLLVSICHSVKAEVYLSPAGSADYIEENNVFASEGISLLYQQYTHPVYSQLHGEFMTHMSAIDLLFNEGPASLDIIRSGRGKNEGLPQSSRLIP